MSSTGSGSSLQPELIGRSPIGGGELGPEHSAGHCKPICSPTFSGLYFVLNCSNVCLLEDVPAALYKWALMQSWDVARPLEALGGLPLAFARYSHDAVPIAERGEDLVHGLLAVTVAHRRRLPAHSAPPESFVFNTVDTVTIAIKSGTIWRRAELEKYTIARLITARCEDFCVECSQCFPACIIGRFAHCGRHA